MRPSATAMPTSICGGTIPGAEPAGDSPTTAAVATRIASAPKAFARASAGGTKGQQCKGSSN